jgi:hypothetical protein
VSERDEPDWGELFDVRDLATTFERENPDSPDNWWWCPSGRHFGKFGGAGVIPWTRHRGTLWVCLSRRSGMTEQGNCWSVLGGALNGSEPAWLCALREAPRRGPHPPELLRL